MDAPDLLRLNVKRSIFIAVAFVLLPISTGLAQTEEVPGCGSLGQNYIGYARDYYTATAADRKLVEGAHFDDEHAALSRGGTTINNARAQGPVGGGLDYVLRVWPNHPLALADLNKYAKIKKSDRPDKMRWTVDCYYKRAITFVPNDGMVRFLYAIYLADFGKETEALENIELAEKLLVAPSTNTLYNMGLVYFRLKRYDDAKRLATIVYEQGYDLPGLKKQLQQAGKW